LPLPKYNPLLAAAKLEERKPVRRDVQWRASTWTCKCGYANRGSDRCQLCHARPPDEVADRLAAQPVDEILEEDLKQERRRSPSVKAGRTAGRTVVRVIVLNVVVQGLTFGISVSQQIALARAIKLSLFSGLLFYAVVGALVVGRSAELGLRPRLMNGKAWRGVVEGLIVGAGLAAFLTAVLRVVMGHPVLDPTAVLLSSEASVGAAVVGVLVIGLLAPVIEELVFRGFLAEALRNRGRRVAILVSAAAFSVAHLRFAQFRYYLAMGVVLGLVYWRRGLLGSVTAHAAFNSMLLAVAVVASHGPATEVRAAGSTLTMPAPWYTQSSSLDDFVAVGPAGAVFELGFLRLTEPPPPAEDLARELLKGTLAPPPGVALDYTTVGLPDLPVGHAVSMDAAIEGAEGHVVLLPRADRLWVGTVRTGGSSRARGDFDRMLVSWRLS
jgi:membrane protease YdiL (CAAX protease family)